MNLRRRLFGFCRISMLLIVLTTAGWLAQPVAAAETSELGDSLKLVPEDAAFYVNLLRNREQFDAVVNSNAFTKIKEMPAVQMGMMIFQMQMSDPNSELVQFFQTLNAPENRKIVDLSIDMVSHEVFIYGDESVADALQLYQDLNGANQSAVIGALMTGRMNGGGQELQQRKLIETAVKDIDLIAVPNTVIGFRVTNKELAAEQFSKLETMADLFFNSQEETKGRFKKTKIGDNDYLVLELDGNMLPWEEAELDELKSAEPNEGDVDKIVERIKQSKLVIAVGIRDDFLLVSIGSTLECLKKLGTGPRLIDSKELKPIEKFADRRITSVSFISAEMNRKLNNQKQQIDKALSAVDSFLPEAELNDAQKERIRKDAEEIAGELKSFVYDVGATTTCSFLTDDGIESYRFAWGDFSELNGTQQLTLLQHVGGNPLLGIVLRTRINVEEYELVSKWAKTAYGYFEEFGLPNMQEDERRKFKDFMDGAKPLIERLDEVNRTLLIPSIEDGQIALILDDKLFSKQLCKNMTPAEEPLAMVEPALVIGLSDADMFRQAMNDYREIANGLIDAMREVEGTDVPEDANIPEPEESENSEGKVYSIPLPEEWGVDKQIVPNLGISEKLAVFSASHAHTARLMEAKPLAVGGVLAETNRPMAVAAWLNWADMIDSAKPWMMYYFKQSSGFENVDDMQVQMVVGQLESTLEVLKVLRTISSKSYFEDGALVSHTLFEIRDMDE